jgi:hypothetical protein
MKKFNKTIVILIVAMLLCMFASSCQDEPLGVPDINYNLPEITEIKGPEGPATTGDTVTVSVSAINGSSYSWSEANDAGTFVDATTNPARWVAPAEPGIFRLTCKVSNSSGSRHATVTIQVEAESGLGDSYWPFDLDFSDNVGVNDAEGDDFVVISTEVFAAGGGSAQFTSAEESETGQLVAGTGLGMGVDDDFTVSLWINTTDAGEGFLFGKSGPDGNYVEGGSCIWLTDGGNVNIDVSWIGGAGGTAVVNDGAWHHVAWRKTGTTVTTYIDGVVDIDNQDIGDWGDDTDFEIVMGAGWEDPAGGEWWPGNYQGYMDEVQFYQEALSDQDMIGLYTNQKAHWTFNMDFGDAIGENDGEGDETISISETVFIEGSGSAFFESADETETGQLFAGTELGMGEEHEFTITLWIKTTDTDGYIIGKTSPDGLYIEGANCIYLSGGTVIVDVSWVGAADGAVAVNDDAWHHVAYVKSGTTVSTYIDGVVDIDNQDIGGWSDDTDFQITMGAGWEEPGTEWWPGNYQGYMDDVRFFQKALPASMITAIYEEHAP